MLSSAESSSAVLGGISKEESGMEEFEASLKQDDDIVMSVKQENVICRNNT